MKIKLTCAKCKNDFYYERKSLKGKLPIYCANCKQELILESKRKYRDKHKEDTIRNTKIINTNVYKANNDYLAYTEKMLNLLGQLDTLRVSMCNLASELSQYQSNYDKKDQEFLHQIELNTFTNGTDALTFINNWHNDRSARRDMKTLIKFLGDMLSAIPVKTKFSAINIIQNNKLKEKK